MPLTTIVRPNGDYALTRSLSELRHGPRDPTVRIRRNRVVRATWTPLGPASVSYAQIGAEIHVEAWGPGAEHAIATAPDVLGAKDDLAGWEPGRNPVVGDLDRRMPGFRFPATGAVLEALVPTILEQKVTSEEAHESWRQMIWAWGEDAPDVEGLRLPPSAAKLSGEPYFAFHRFNLERKRTDIVKRVADRAPRVEEAATLGRARLEAFAGIGPWTSAKVAQVAWADADAVPVGDFHLPKIVVYSLTGKRGGDDDAMLELLAPFAPHRGRAAELLHRGGSAPARRAPRMALRDLRAI